MLSEPLGKQSRTVPTGLLSPRPANTLGIGEQDPYGVQYLVKIIS